MDSQNDFNGGIIGRRRKGDYTDPFKSISETLPIINGKATLTEVPNKFEKVSVTGSSSTLYEIEDGELSDILYKVDYVNGVVFFNISHNNTNLTFTYLGEGQQYFPSSSVWLTQSTNGSIQTAEDKFNSLDADIASQKARVDTQINSVPQPNEILDIRVDKNGNVYTVAKERIDAEQAKIEDAYHAKSGATFNSLKERLDKSDDDMGDVGTLITNSKVLVGAVNESLTYLKSYTDASLVSAKGFAMQYGIGSQLYLNRITSDLNSSKTGGFFYVDAVATNKPVTSGGYLIVMAKDNNYVAQTFIDEVGGVVYTRSLFSAWGKWKQLQITPITDQFGSYKLSITDTSKDLLQEIVTLGIGMHTFYALGGVINLPGTDAVRGIAHITDASTGWIYATDINNNIFTNFYNNGAWKGWQQLLSPSSVVTGAGERIEIVELSFTGGAYAMTSSGNFSKAFSTPPTVIPAYVSQSISYMDTMSFPYLNFITTTGFGCVLKTSNTSNAFGAGTGKMKFFVFGK